MAEFPLQRRLTDTTPDEWLAEYIPLLCMLLFGSELVEVVRRRKSEGDAAKTHGPAADARAREQAGIAWSNLDRLEKCIQSYASRCKLLGDVDALRRQTARGEYIVPTADEFGQLFELRMEPKKHFFSKLRERVLTVLRDKLAEDPHADIDEFHALLLECFTGGSGTV